MSKSDLREFNLLNKRHNYLMTNNRVNGFPSLKENSLLLKKVLQTKTSQKKEEISHKDLNQNKIIVYKKPENIQIKVIQKPIITVTRKSNNTIDNFYKNPIYNFTAKRAINPYKKILRNNIYDELSETDYYKVPIQDIRVSSPNVNIQRSGTFSNFNITNYEIENGILCHKGRKIFPINSFSGIKNSSINNSPEKNKYKKIRKESELFRNTDELMKKKREIYERKIKRESSAIKRQLLKEEEDKNIKNEKLNIDISSAFSTINKDKSIGENKIYVNRSRIINNKHTNGISNKKDDDIKKTIISSYSKKNNDKNDFLNNISQSNKYRRRIYKYKINRNSINNLKNQDSQKEERINTLNNINDLKNQESQKEERVNTVNNINNNGLYSKMKFKTNNIYISKHNKYNSSKSIGVVNTNNKSSLNDSRAHTISRNLSKNRFTSSNKRYIEDIFLEPPIIYSDDKKISIKVHTLQNMNETFFGKRMTRDKLKMQRSIIMTIADKNNKLKYRKIKPTTDKKPLSSIKEEIKIIEEKKPKIYKYKPKNEIKGNGGFQTNIKKRYLNRLENKK